MTRKVWWTRQKLYHAKYRVTAALRLSELFRERIRYPGETTQVHTQTQIRPLDVRGADVLGIGPTVADFGYNLRDVSWGVPLIPVLTVISVELHKLREVHRSAEHVLDSPLVEVKPVSSHLESPRRKALPQAGKERQRGFSGALADLKARDEFGFRVKRDENPLVAKFGGIAAANVPRLLAHVAPEFIALHVIRLDSTHLGIENMLRVRRRSDHQRENRILVRPREAGNGANAHPLKHQGERLCRNFGIGIVSAERRGASGISKCRVAGIAAPTLNPSLAVGSESLADLVLASRAGHVVSPLAFGGETSQNRLSRSEAWVTPRFGLAPPTVRAADGGADC